MAEFTAAVYQNEFLPDGGTDVNAIVTVAVQRRRVGRPDRRSGDAGEIIIVDTSGSMGRTKLEAAKAAASAAIDQILDGTWFAVVAGTHQAYLAYPPVRAGAGMVRMNPSSPVRGAPGDRPVPLRRRNGDGHLADAGRATVRLGADAGPEARDPAHRRREPQRDTRTADQRHRWR